MWVEEFRPSTLDEVLGQDTITNRLKAFLQKPTDMPHMLFAGPPGVGKTTSAYALARELFGDYFDENFAEMNASDERKLSHIRTFVKRFVKFQPAGGMPFKLLLLDEADALKRDSQSALRRIMEHHSHNVRFILIVNYAGKIIDPILSRCAVFRFQPIAKTFVDQRLRELSEINHVDITPEAIDVFYELLRGDMRTIVNLLQSLSVMHGRRIDVGDVYEVLGRPHPDKIQKVLSSLALKSPVGLEQAHTQVEQLLSVEGFQAKDILVQLAQAVEDSPEFTEEDHYRFNHSLADLEYRIAQGADDRIQLSALLMSVFGLFVT